MRKYILSDEQIKHYIEKLMPFQERDPQKAHQGRQRYLAEVKLHRQDLLLSEAVSITLYDRLNGWIKNLKTKFSLKERLMMNPLRTSLIIAAVLLFGGASVTAFAAQSSLPTDLLYPVKMVGETVHLELVADDESQLQLTLVYATRRMEEAAAMIQNGEAVPEVVANQLEQHYNLALMLALGMDDEAAPKALEQIRANIRQQERLMSNIGKGAGQEDAVLSRIRQMLQTQNRLCEQALEDPLQLRQMQQQQLQHMESSSNGNGGQEPTPAPTESSTSAIECTSCEPVLDGTGPGPGPNTEPGSGNGSNGSGNNSCTDCTPDQDGTGPGPGPNTDPGSGNGSNGNGNNSCTDCTPVQDGTGPGDGPNAGPGK